MNILLIIMFIIFKLFVDFCSKARYDSRKKCNGYKEYWEHYTVEQEEMIFVEMAKVTSKGQITIPVSIRKRLNINEGDKVLFLDTTDGVMMVNPDVRPAEPSSGDTSNAVSIEHMNFTPGPDKTDALVEKISDREFNDATATRQPPPEKEKPPLHANQYDVNKLLDEIRSFREKY